MAFSVGIDLGTTNTVVSTSRRGVNGTVEVITEMMEQIKEDGYSLESDPLLPSVLYVEDGEHSIGKLAKAMRGQKRNRVIYNSKNNIGQADYKWEIDGQTYSPEVVASYFLSAAKKHLIEKYNDEESLKNIVITVPASFNIDQREATKLAAKIAGFEGNITLISEPTAAILDFINEQSKFLDEDKCLDFNENKNILVFDLGGGTCDVSILNVKINQSKIYVEEKAVSPHTLLGGSTFDVYALEGIIEKYEKNNNVNLKKEIGEKKLNDLKSKLLVQLEQSKIFFSGKYFNKKDSSDDLYALKNAIKRTIQIPNAINGEPFKFEITMNDYNNLIRLLLVESSTQENVITPIQKTLNEAAMKKEDMDYIFCVGGMTKYPAVTDTIEKFFGKKPVAFCDNMHSVSRGAAVYNNYELLENKNNKNEEGKAENERLIDIIPTLPQSIFLNVKDGFPKLLIEAKTKAGTPKKLENLIKVTSEVGVTLEIYSGRSVFDPEMKKLQNIKLDFVRGVERGTDITLEVEYTKEGTINFEAWVENNPEIKATVTLEEVNKIKNIETIRKEHKINNVKGVC